MPNVTITNLTSADLYVSDLYITLGAGEATTVYRSADALMAMKDTHELINNGEASLGIAYTADEIGSGFNPYPGLGSGGFAGQQVYYVGKHGADTNDGKSPEQAFLTFGKAFTEAAAQTPSSSNQFAVVCADAGVYTESVTMAQWVHLFAPAASIVGTLTVADDTIANVHSIEVSGSAIGVSKPSGQTSISRVEANVVRATGSATGILSAAASGVLIAEVRSVYAENGYGVGEISTTQGHMHLMIEDLYITGTGGGVVRFGSGQTVGYVGHILEVGGGIGNGTALNLIGGDLELKVLRLQATTAYIVGGSATLRLDSNFISGSTSITGTAYVNTAGYIPVTPGDWAGIAPTNLNVAIDRLSAAVAGLLGGQIP
jgi:hypothetical protein